MADPFGRALREPAGGLRPKPLRVLTLRALIGRAGEFHELVAIIACLAIWGGTFLAIGRL